MRSGDQRCAAWLLVEENPYKPSLRSKNISSILVKSLIDTIISAICYYLVGFAFTLGQGSPVNGEFINRPHKCVTNSLAPVSYPPYESCSFYWQWRLCLECLSRFSEKQRPGVVCLELGVLCDVHDYCCWEHRREINIHFVHPVCHLLCQLGVPCSGILELVA